MKEEVLVAIFCKGDNKLNLETTALAEYDVETKKFIIKYGNYKNLGNDNFNVLSGNPGFVGGKQHVLKIGSHAKNDTLFYVYLFHRNFINSIAKIRNISLNDAYHYLTKKLFNLTLHVRDDGYEPVLCKSNYASIWNYSDIERMLHGNPEPILKPKDSLIGIVDENELNTSSFISASDPNFFDRIYNINFSKDKASDTVVTPKIDINDVINKISSKFVGQEEVIKSLVTNIYFNQLLIDDLEKKHETSPSVLDSRKVSILLDGSTGTGKTAIMKEISKNLDLPIITVNANSFSETGYVGPSITDILDDLLKKADNNLEKAERGIVVLDEIDKITQDVSHEKSMKKGVQEELLGFISGGTYDIQKPGLMRMFEAPKTSFDTSRLTFIFSGAFTALRERKIKENESNSIGFNTDGDKVKEKSYYITPEDYINEGLMREFFGRIKLITSTNTYTVEDLKNILLNSEISPIKNLEYSVNLLGYDKIEYEEGFIDKIAEEAYKMNSGARALQTVIDGVKNKILYSLMTGQFDKNKPISFTNDMIEAYKSNSLRRY